MATTNDTGALGRQGLRGADAYRHGEPDDAPLRVMLAVDGSDEAQSAASDAVDLFGPEALYTVVGIGAVRPVMPAAGLGLSVAPSMIWLSSDRSGPLRASRGAVQEVSGDVSAVNLETIVEVGRPGRRLVELATERDTDILVIGGHDRGWLSRLFAPSVTRYLIAHAPCPVLVVRG